MDVDLFCGTGGSTLGAKLAGHRAFQITMFSMALRLRSTNR